MQYYYLINEKTKQAYYLGNECTAKYYIPYLAYRFRNDPVILIGDETNEDLYDKYISSYEVQLHVNVVDHTDDINDELLSDIEMSKAEFMFIFKQINGQTIMNFNDYIQYQYH